MRFLLVFSFVLIATGVELPNTSTPNQCVHVLTSVCDGKKVDGDASYQATQCGGVSNEFATFKTSVENEMRALTVAVRQLQDVVSLLLQNTQLIQATATPSIVPLNTDSTPVGLPADCSQTTANGIVTLRSGKRVYCSEGWLVFQFRFNGSINFMTYTWEQFKTGFGKLDAEFWLGLDELNEITWENNCRLRIDLWDFDDSHVYAEYNEFSVGNETEFYRLRISGYKGTAGDEMFTNSDSQNNMLFSTIDRDHDRSRYYKCAKDKGAWWFNGCSGARLNGFWTRKAYVKSAIAWDSWKTKRGGITRTEMKVRCDVLPTQVQN